MSDNLQGLSALLREGQKRSAGSYRRRAPADAAVPYLLRARQGLRMVVRRYSGNAQAWRLLSEAEEALLDYVHARSALEKALALEDGAERRDLKKLALLREYEAWWGGLGLTPLQLAELGRCLEAALVDMPCDHTLSRTSMWLECSGLPNPDQIMQALGERGGYCDCEILNNVVHA
jgi:tetratricopeptide (TPR) repeat protein